MQRDTKLLLSSFFLLNLLNWISIVEFKYGIPLIIKYILSIGILSIIVWYWMNQRVRPRPGSLFYPIIVFFVSWSVLLIVQAVLNFDDLFYLQRVFGQRFFFIPYVLPIFILFSKFDIQFFGLYFRVASFSLIFATIMQLTIIVTGMDRVTWFEQTTRIFIFDIGSSFVILTSHLFFKRKITYISICYFTIYLFIWSYFGRRGMMIEYSLILFLMLILRIRSPLLKRIDRMQIYFIGIAMVLILVNFSYLFLQTYAFQRGFDRSAFEASRGIVFQDFFQDFNSIQDWLLGRGLLGTVTRSILGYDEAGFIENGFLNILLKGGVLYLLPFLIILFRASYLGFFRSHNDLTKALALIILVHIIMMAYFNLPDYSPKYILTLIATASCFNSDLRKISNEEVVRVLNLK